MNVFIVTYTNGESVIDYGTYDQIIGVYTTLGLAVKARANYAKEFQLIDPISHKELGYIRTKCWHITEHQGGYIEITKLELDDNKYLPGKGE